MDARAGAVRASILGVVGVAFLLIALVPAARAGPILPTYAGLAVTLDANGTLAVDLSTQVPNGSALRDAMDGNFTPLLHLLGVNATETARAIDVIDGLEQDPLTAGSFGNHDGEVSSYEVTVFEGLVSRESALVPSGLLGGSGLVPTTLDSAGPVTEALGSVRFTGAIGPDISTAPIGVQIQSTDSFALGGASHTLTMGAPDLPFDLPGSFDLNVSFTTPDGETITEVMGTSSDQVTNDPLGWGPASMSGSLAATRNTSVTIDFENATPVGTILVVAGSAVAVVAVAGGLIWRRRRKAQAPPSPPTAGLAPPNPPPSGP